MGGLTYRGFSATCQEPPEYVNYDFGSSLKSEILFELVTFCFEALLELVFL